MCFLISFVTDNMSGSFDPSCFVKGLTFEEITLPDLVGLSRTHLCELAEYVDVEFDSVEIRKSELRVLVLERLIYDAYVHSSDVPSAVEISVSTPERKLFKLYHRFHERRQENQARLRETLIKQHEARLREHEARIEQIRLKTEAQLRELDDSICAISSPVVNPIVESDGSDVSVLSVVSVDPVETVNLELVDNICRESFKNVCRESVVNVCREQDDSVSNEQVETVCCEQFEFDDDYFVFPCDAPGLITVTCDCESNGSGCVRCGDHDSAHLYINSPVCDVSDSVTQKGDCTLCEDHRCEGHVGDSCSMDVCTVADDSVLSVRVVDDCSGINALNVVDDDVHSVDPF